MKARPWPAAPVRNTPGPWLVSGPCWLDRRGLCRGGWQSYQHRVLPSPSRASNITCPPVGRLKGVALGTSGCRLQRQLKGIQRLQGNDQQRKRPVAVELPLLWATLLQGVWLSYLQRMVLACVFGVFGMLRHGNLVPGTLNVQSAFGMHKQLRSWCGASGVVPVPDLHALCVSVRAFGTLQFLLPRGSKSACGMDTFPQRLPILRPSLYRPAIRMSRAMSALWSSLRGAQPCPTAQTSAACRAQQPQITQPGHALGACWVPSEPSSARPCVQQPGQPVPVKQSQLQRVATDVVLGARAAGVVKADSTAAVPADSRGHSCPWVRVLRLSCVCLLAGMALLPAPLLYWPEQANQVGGAL